MNASINTLGTNIRSLRQKLGWNQAEAAKRLQISTPAFSKIETGITDISISRLNELADIFQVDVASIIAPAGERSSAVDERLMNECKADLILA